MTTKAHIPRKFVWLIALVATIAIVLLTIWLEQSLTPAQTIVTNSPPLFSVPSGNYNNNFSLKLTTENPDAQIIYTTNSHSPEPASALTYTSPIILNAAEPNVTVIRARTVLPDGSMSDEVIGTYAMGVETDLPLVSLVVEPNDLWSTERGILTNPKMSGREWERAANITYLDENGRLAFSEPVGIRLHGQASRFLDKQSMRLYFRREYGPGRLNYPLYPESDVISFDRLVLHSGGQDTSQFSANWTLMRTQLMAKLAQQIDAYTTNNQPVLLFLNGKLYGIYHLRERSDETYFQDHYGIENVQVLNITHREPEQPKEIEDWQNLVAYAAGNDMANPDHYAYVLSQIDIDNMIDHYILQMYAANNDWPQNNERIFRSDDPLARWQWFLWDVDYSFGLMPVSSLDFDMVTWLMHPKNSFVEDTTLLFRSLWANLDFRNRFLVRTADLLNSELSSENVSAQLAQIEAKLINDIGYEIARWGNPGNWYTSAEEMQTFAEERPNIMRRHFIEGFNLSGTAVFSFKPAAAGKGSLILNGRRTPDLPYTGEYFLDTTIEVTAIPDAGYQFAGWEVNGEMVGEETAVLHYTLTQDTTITPHFTRP